MEQHFCYAKVVACGRVIEREWVNPSKVPPSHSPFLAMCRGADNKICTQSQKKHHPSGWCFLFGMSRADANSLPRPARSALNQEVRQGSCEWLCHSWDAGSESSLVARSKKERHPHGCLSFLELHFCYAKVVACGRVIEREWVNPSKVPPSHSPFLAMCRGADNKICTQSQKKHHPSGWCFLFGMSRADANSLPRPARSALNQEVRQGSCEWLCHSWDAGSESSHVMRTSLPERWST